MKKSEKLVLLIFALSPLALIIALRSSDSAWIPQLFTIGFLGLLMGYLFMQFFRRKRSGDNPKNNKNKPGYVYPAIIITTGIIFYALGTIIYLMS